MAYLNIKMKALINKMDKEFKEPKQWKKFILQEETKNNLIIKNKDNCSCTKCGHEFKTNKKINEYEKCPSCKNSLLIKRFDLMWYEFNKIVIVLDRINEEYVLRLFQLQSQYRDKKMTHSLVEYARDIIGFITIVNERAYSNNGSLYIAHSKAIGKWRKYDAYYGINKEGKLYPHNLKKLFENTQYKYSQIWKLAEKSDDISMQYMLSTGMKYNSFEILIKMGLYKLAECPKTFNVPGTFEKRFDISKEYYPFMKRNNLDLSELEILKLIKTKNMNTIRALSIYSLEHLTAISKYMNVKELLNYKLTMQQVNIYVDYLSFAEKLGYDLKDKKYLFPKNLKEEHDRLAEQIEINNQKPLDKKIKKRYSKLKQFIFKNKEYLIEPVKSIAMLIDESKQQNNCVRTYAEDYADKECDIYVMRNISDVNISLVTIEVRNNKVVQARIKHNEVPQSKEMKFIHLWEKKILKGAVS